MILFIQFCKSYTDVNHYLKKHLLFVKVIRIMKFVPKKIEKKVKSNSEHVETAVKLSCFYVVIYFVFGLISFIILFIFMSYLARILY